MKRKSHDTSHSATWLREASPSTPVAPLVCILKDHTSNPCFQTDPSGCVITTALGQVDVGCFGSTLFACIISPFLDRLRPLLDFGNPVLLWMDETCFAPSGMTETLYWKNLRNPTGACVDFVHQCGASPPTIVPSTNTHACQCATWV